MASLIYEIASALHSTIGYFGAVLVPFVVLMLLIRIQFRSYSFNLSLFASIFLLFPAFTPSLSKLLGYDYFTRLNYNLQLDEILVVAATLLISMFTAAFILGSMAPNNFKSVRNRTKMFFPPLPGAIVLGINFILILLFLESGSVLTQSYGSIKLDQEAPFSSLVNQSFNASVAIILCYIGGLKRQRLIAFYYCVMIVVFLLFARRTTVIGLAILLIYNGGMDRFSKKQLVLLGVSAFLLVFVGEARTVGILNYIDGARSTSVKDLFFALPGGSSNIFVGTMGVIELMGIRILSFPETFPILLWASGVYESEIYKDYYQYNGGMHIANIFYWNFGLIGIAFGGFGLGWITMRVHIIASRVSRDLGGTLPSMLSFAYILVLPNLLWYGPIATIKLTFAITVFYMIFAKIFKRN